MKLNSLFANAPELEIEQLAIDSRLPMKNAIFFCLDGIKYDGHNFVNEAIDNGAIVIIHSKPIETNRNVVYVKVNSVNETLFRIADEFYNHPNNGIDEYVISGCYGRSSVSSIIKHYLDKKTNCGYIGIFGINYKSTHLSVTFPALTSLDNLKVLNNMKKESITSCVFESSPISLYYKKLDVLKPKVFIYTNTSKYSPDYKSCNNMYFSYLRRYLYTLEDKTNIVLNIDDESYYELTDSVNNYVTYGFDSNADYRINEVVSNLDKTSFSIIHDDKVYKVESKLLGNINVYNITAAIVGLHLNGYDINDIIENISDINCIDGIMERIDDKNIIIDCASELDSIKNVLEFARENQKGRIIVLIGINYSDDEKYIEELMNLLQKYCNSLILTEDESLDAEIMNLLSKADKYCKIKDVVHIGYRSLAIKNAIDITGNKDILLILGKGSEDYLSMGLGKERYYGDKYYALKYIKENKENENEII